MKISSDFFNFFTHLRSIPANSANAMIRQHLVRAFERGAWRDHRPGYIGTFITFSMIGSTNVSTRSTSKCRPSTVV